MLVLAPESARRALGDPQVTLTCPCSSTVPLLAMPASERD